MMDTAWYLRLFYMPILNAIVSVLLSVIIKAKRMSGPGVGKPWMVVILVSVHRNSLYISDIGVSSS